MSHTAPQAPASSRRAAPYRDRRSLGTRAGTGVERPALEKRGVRAAQVCWLVGAWRRGGGTVLPARAHRCGAVTGRGLRSQMESYRQRPAGSFGEVEAQKGHEVPGSHCPRTWTQDLAVPAPRLRGALEASCAAVSQAPLALFLGLGLLI